MAAGDASAGRRSEQRRERVRARRRSSRRRRCRGSAGRAPAPAQPRRRAARPGASAPTQRVIACARRSRAASCGAQPAGGDLLARPTSRRPSAGGRRRAPIQYARLSPSQPIAISSARHTAQTSVQDGHRDVGATCRRGTVADGARSAAATAATVAASRSPAPRGSRRASTSPAACGRGRAPRRRRTPRTRSRRRRRGDDRVADELEMEGVLVALVHAALVADGGRGAEVELHAPVGHMLVRGRLVAGARAALLAEAVVRDEQRVARLAAQRGRVAHVHVLGRTSLARSTSSMRSSAVGALARELAVRRLEARSAGRGPRARSPATRTSAGRAQPPCSSSAVERGARAARRSAARAARGRASSASQDRVGRDESATRGGPPSPSSQAADRRHARVGVGARASCTRS